MGLFTNRKRDDETVGLVSSAEAIDALAPRAIEGVDWDDDAMASTPVDPEVAAPFDETTENDSEAAEALAEYGITLEDTEPAVPPAPRRTSGAAPDLQAGNVEIDADGLLEMLGVRPDASLAEISEARLRFVAEHDPVAETDEEAAQIKERIRRQINVAYASFRLTRSP